MSYTLKMPSNLAYLKPILAGYDGYLAGYDLCSDLRSWLDEYCRDKWSWNNELWNKMSDWEARLYHTHHMSEHLAIFITIEDSEIATLFKLTWL